MCVGFAPDRDNGAYGVLFVVLCGNVGEGYISHKLKACWVFVVFNRRLTYSLAFEGTWVILQYGDGSGRVSRD